MDRSARRPEPAALRDDSAAEFRKLYTDAKRAPAAAELARKAAAIAARRRVRATLRELAAVVGPRLAAARRAEELDTPAPELAALYYEQAAGRADRGPFAEQFDAGAVVDAPDLPEPPARRRGLFDQTGTRDDEPPTLAHPENERPEAHALTVYAVALIYAPRQGSTADPVVILRQFVRSGNRPVSHADAVTVCAALEAMHWKPKRGPLEEFDPPTGIVTYRVIPAFA